MLRKRTLLIEVMLGNMTFELTLKVITAKSTVTVLYFTTILFDDCY
jgi:hypothetical protein